MNGPSNTAMHLSRHRMAIYFDEHTLRPGDGKRWNDANSRIRIALAVYV